MIAAIQPAIYAKGGDYSVASLNLEELSALRSAGARVEILPLVPDRSTSGLLDRLHKL